MSSRCHPWPDRTDLVCRLQSQDPEAIRKMVDQFTPLLLRQAYALLGSLPEAEDATQEVLLKAIQKLPGFRGGSLSAWLAAINHHHCLDLLRQQNRNKISTKAWEGLPASHPDAGACGSASAESVLELMRELPEIEREVLHLRVIEELDYSEIASITGYTEGSVRNVFSRGLRRLRERFLELTGQSMCSTPGNWESRKDDKAEKISPSPRPLTQQER